ncbi:MOSC domain-containing protein [Oceanobacter mangrovi]|uniref:MOSC domain-containing protein n=1 Tax=Oceanobacter mangrovi TaxID=2862510 RepID=UPI001C8EAA48|nr:MOSC N-terminal beta barrel domain-containing protein [Oceanobacter mangrovi]
MAFVTVSSLFIYPVKSCAGLAVSSLRFDQQGPLHDRRYMVVDPDGKFLTQRQLPAMAHIYPQLDEAGELSLAAADAGVIQVPAGGGEWLEVNVWGDSVQAQDCGAEVASWLSDLLQRPCRLVYLTADSQRLVDQRYAEAGELVSFADGFPVLVVSESSLQALSEEAGLDIDVRRFRPNVVVSGSAAFAELQWHQLVAGESSLVLVKPCERCVIPTRDMVTQQRQPAVTAALKSICLHKNKLIFGVNALVREMDSLHVGQVFDIVAVSE